MTRVARRIAVRARTTVKTLSPSAVARKIRVRFYYSARRRGPSRDLSHAFRRVFLHYCSCAVTHDMCMCVIIFVTSAAAAAAACFPPKTSRDENRLRLS